MVMAILVAVCEFLVVGLLVAVAVLVPVDARVDGCTRGQVGEFVVVGIRVRVGVLVVVGAFGDM